LSDTLGGTGAKVVEAALEVCDELCAVVTADNEVVDEVTAGTVVPD